LTSLSLSISLSAHRCLVTSLFYTSLLEPFFFSCAFYFILLLSTPHFTHGFVPNSLWYCGNHGLVDHPCGIVDEILSNTFCNPHCFHCYMCFFSSVMWLHFIFFGLMSDGSDIRRFSLKMRR
jgi:hypothetical protein